MNIQQAESETKGAFFITDGDHHLAEMTYSKAGTDRIIIDHTEVGDQLRGTGVGESLVEFAVNYARINNIKIIPLCVFANSVFQKRPELRDVL